MKKLYLIGGTMGVGKTAVCQALKRKLPNAVFLDGDWCWDSSPFQVNAQTKKMVMKNICFLLNQFLRCSSYENVIFCWVMHEQEIINTILAGIDTADCEAKLISLVCNPATLEQRLKKDILDGKRRQDVIERSAERLPLYNKLNTVKIATDGKTLDEITNNIIAL